MLGVVWSVRNFYFFFRFFLSVRRVSGWCVVCGGIGGLLDVRNTSYSVGDPRVLWGPPLV